jgi:hypothetical protein
VLGRRWVYDACGDPVYAAALATAILTGAGQAEEFVDVDGQLVRRQPAMAVTGSGADGAEVPTVKAVRRVVDEDPTLIVTDSVELAVVRVVDGTGAVDGDAVDGGGSPPAGPTLTGTWQGRSAPALLSYLR